jgi:signal transduction histidine kinase
VATLTGAGTWRALLMNEPNEPEYKANILIVDDTPANLQVLAGMLRDRGYKARPIPCGKLALQAAKNLPPDLILLDINMPDMNGYEVCQQLKADPALKDIPVLFISALNETVDKLKAFEVGGVDYITKPFRFEEVNARVEVHIDLLMHRRQLQKSYADLRKLEEMRDGLIHIVVHDMRSPLNGISGFLELIEMIDGNSLSPKGKTYMANARQSTRRLLEMVNSLLDISKMEARKLELHRSEVDLVAIAREAIAQAESQRGARTVTVEAPADLPQASVDAELVFRIFQNLIGNALKFTPADGTVKISLAVDNGQIRCVIADNGPGIPAEFHQRIFEKFGQVHADRQRLGTGLGLNFCKLAVEAHGGRIGLESEAGKGSRFWFSLPR